jgi:hypothetical protein
MHDVVVHNMCELTSWTFDLMRWKPSIVPAVAHPDLLQYALVLLAGWHSCQLKGHIKLLQADLHSIGHAMRADSHSILHASHEGSTHLSVQGWQQTWVCEWSVYVLNEWSVLSLLQFMHKENVS